MPFSVGEPSFTTLDTSVGSKDDTAYGYFAGAGVDFKITILLLNIEAKYLWVEPSFSGTNRNIEGVVVTAGIGVEF